MENVVWLSLAYPGWYVSTLRAPFAHIWLTTIPASGVVALAAGLILALVKREPAVLLAVGAFLISHAYVAIAAFFRGQYSDSGPSLIAFLVVVAALVVFMIVRARASRLAAILVGWFTVTYALFSGFVGSMAFADVWM